MEPTFSTSFIPKRPISSVAPEAAPTSHRATGLLSFITIIIVVATVAGFGWVYVDEKQLVSKRDELTTAINEARLGLGTAFVLDIKRLSERIEGAKALLQRHTVVSPIFSALEQSTLKTVQYKNFTYTYLADPSTNAAAVNVQVTGTAKGYQSLALQSDAFTANVLVKNPIFSGLTIDEKTNRVDFKLVFTVNAADLSYEKFVASLSNVSAQTPVQAQ